MVHWFSLVYPGTFWYIYLSYQLVLVYSGKYQTHCTMVTAVWCLIHFAPDTLILGYFSLLQHIYCTRHTTHTRPYYYCNMLSIH